MGASYTTCPIAATSRSCRGSTVRRMADAPSTLATALGFDDDAALLGLSFGKFVLDDRSTALLGCRSSVALKIRQHIGPDTPSLAGWEYIFPLQALAEFLEEQIRKCSADGSNGI